MSRLFYHVCQDNLGNLLFGVSGTMRLSGSGTLATIYGDEAMTVILPNPMTNHPSFGSFKCFLGAGNYDFYLSKGGYTFETLTGVQGHGTMAHQNAHDVAITGGTAVLTRMALGGFGLNEALSLNLQGDTVLSGLVGIGGSPSPAQGILSVYGTIWSNAATGLILTQGGQMLSLGLGGYGPNPLYALNLQGDSNLNGVVGIGGVPNVLQGILNVYGTMWSNAATGLILTQGGQMNALGLGGYPPAAATPLNVQGKSILNGQVSIGTAATSGQVSVEYHIAAFGLWLKAQQPGSAFPAVFVNSVGTQVGSISHSDAATAFNTTSDARLKEAVEPLAGALDVVRALNPVSFLWKADGTPGRGFLAHEVQQMVPEAVTGAAGAVREDGRIDPQGVDFSKLVPWLVSAVKELTEQVEMLTAKLAAASA